MTRQTCVVMLVAALVTALAGVSGAGAQTYPSRPITMNVPFAPGGPLDTVARVLAVRMRASLGQSVIIENVGGAGGSLGVGRVARAAPDGYTIGAGNWATHVAIGAIYALPFDLINDLVPVIALPSEPNLIVARKNFPADNLRELIAWLRNNPDKAMAGTSGVGGPSYMAALFFQKETGTRFQLLPYRGISLAMQDLLAGQIDLISTGPSVLLSLLADRAIKAYAVTAKARLASAPDVPSVDEVGLPGLYISVWHGLWAPKATPPAIVARLNEAAKGALADPVTRAKLAKLGQEIPPVEQQTPQALAAYQKAEIEKWWPIVKAAGIKPE